MKLEDARAEEREKEKQGKNATKIRGQDAHEQKQNEQFHDDADDRSDYIIMLGESVKARPQRAIKLARSRGGHAASSTLAQQVQSMRRQSSFSCDSIDELSLESDYADD